jgi:hypothetical protein
MDRSQRGKAARKPLQLDTQLTLASPRTFLQLQYGFHISALNVSSL